MSRHLLLVEKHDSVSQPQQDGVGRRLRPTTVIPPSNQSTNLAVAALLTKTGRTQTLAARKAVQPENETTPPAMPY